MVGEVQSDRFLGFLESLFEIEKLYPDPHLKGGGLHETVNGGFLEVHTDFNQGLRNKHRAVNLLLFLNPVWKEEWGGCLELWDSNPLKKARTILPLMNRAVIFRASEDSYHGHPVPLNVPKGVTRKSIAVYYYEDWPEGVRVRNATNYKRTRGPAIS